MIRLPALASFLTVGRCVLGATTVAVGASACAAYGETLQDAVAAAYASNPTLLQQRAALRALDESYVQAAGGLRPTLSISAGGSYNETVIPSQSKPVFGNTGGLTLTASQPLYTGGRVPAALREAEAQVKAGRESLRQTEASVLLSVITAYVDVRRDLKSLAVRRRDVTELKAFLDETTAKFEVGGLTTTDVSQARAQYSAARAALALAEGQLKASRSAYLAAVGQNPGDLAEESPLPALPAGIDQAFDAAERQNPTLREASLNEQASRAKVYVAKAARMPELNASASYGATGTLSPFNTRQYDRALSVGVTVTQPIYQAGQVSSQIRQALELNNVDRIGIDLARRQVVQAVSLAWNGIAAARENVAATLDERDAAQKAFKGFREEFHAGVRTSLDVLVAEQALSNAELAALAARHDEYVAEADLLVAIGKLDARSLGAEVAVYDPTRNFNRVHKAGSVGYDPLLEILDGALSLGPRTPVDPASGIAPGSVKAAADAVGQAKP